MKRKTLDIKENYPLREHTTFKTGGPARYFARADDEYHIAEAYAFAEERKVPLFVLGGGSNILISDKGFPGLAVLNRIKGIDSRIEKGSAFVTAGAGEDWDNFVKQCTGNNWQGLECLSGIPGTAGAAPVQNIGAYGRSVDGSISEVRVFDSHTGEFVTLLNRECGFCYRGSIFNSVSAGRYVITQVTFKLTPGGAPCLTYQELIKRFTSDADITPGRVRDAIIEIRDRKGLLLLEGHESYRSAGSFFKNPAIPAEQFGKVERIIQEENCCTNWAWPLPSGGMKVSAACLIQCAGFARGHRSGNAGLSPRHTLVLVNYGDATAAEIVAFARQVQERVKAKFGVALMPEVQLVGFLPQEGLS